MRGTLEQGESTRDERQDMWGNRCLEKSPEQYQTKNIFTTFLPKQTEKFKQFYKKIKHMEFTTAMLQEFLFYNRKCENILDHMTNFIDIVDKNKPSELSTDKSGQEKNLYM